MIYSNFIILKPGVVILKSGKSFEIIPNIIEKLVCTPTTDLIENEKEWVSDKWDRKWKDINSHNCKEKDENKKEAPRWAYGERNFRVGAKKNLGSWKRLKKVPQNPEQTPKIQIKKAEMRVGPLCLLFASPLLNAQEQQWNSDD